MSRFRCSRLRSRPDRKSTRLNSSHVEISYAVFCLKKKESKSSVTANLAASPAAECKADSALVWRGPVLLKVLQQVIEDFECVSFFFFFFFNDPATPEISPLSLHDPLPI